MATTSSVATSKGPRLAAILTVGVVLAGIVAVALLRRPEPSGTEGFVPPMRVPNPQARPKTSVDVAIIMVMYGQPTRERGQATGRSKNEALEITERVFSRLAAGESFERLQQEFSDDVKEDGRTLFNGGTYTWAEDDKVIPEAVRRIAFSTPVGLVHRAALDVRYAYVILRRDR